MTVLFLSHLPRSCGAKRWFFQPSIHLATVASMQVTKKKKRPVRLSMDEDLYLELIRRFGSKRMHVYVNEAVRKYLYGEGGSQ